MASMMMLVQHSRRHLLRRGGDRIVNIHPKWTGAAAGSSSPQLRRAFASSSDGGDELQKTALFDWHQQRGSGADMVPFAGYVLPVLYKDLGVMKEHLWCREKASLFDVSHMGQVSVFRVLACQSVISRQQLVGAKMIHSHGLTLCFCPFYPQLSAA
jgi:Aminomethyltransferase folate-binding domain